MVRFAVKRRRDAAACWSVLVENGAEGFERVSR
jgi:hypothetical protein